MLKLYHQLYTYTSTGKLLKRTRKRKAKSFVKYFLTHLAALLEGNNSYQTLNIFNSSQTVSANTDQFFRFFRANQCGLDSGCGSTYYYTDNSAVIYVSNYGGIQIGTGTTAINSSDYKLATPITHGTSAGTMVYYGCWSQNLTFTATTGYFEIERIFYNGSGGNITVNEMGIYCVDSSAFCAVRDLVSPGVTVANGEYLKVKYTIQISV